MVRQVHEIGFGELVFPSLNIGFYIYKLLPEYVPIIFRNLWKGTFSVPSEIEGFLGKKQQAAIALKALVMKLVTDLFIEKNFQAR